ncbi:Tf2-11, partial [Mucuna pruriens]
MCDASNSALGAVLGQRFGVGKPVHVIAYASQTMDPTQLNYTTTEKEQLTIVFVLDKFRYFLLGSKIIVFFEHATLRFLLKKPYAKSRLNRDKKGDESSIADHLSRIKRESNPMPIQDEFPDKQLLHINMPTPYFHQRPLGYTKRDFEAMPNIIYGMILTYGDSAMIKCIRDAEIKSVLQFFHVASEGGHYGSTWIARKVLDYGDAYQFVSTCEKCQKVGMAISKRHEMPQQPILFCEVFDVLGIDFMGPFLVSNGYSYILLAVDYVSRWVEAITTKTTNAKVVVEFLKSNIFCRFGVQKALISDQGSHLCNIAMSSLLHKYGVVYRVATTYHRRTNDQAEVFNRKIKKTLQKMTNPSRKDWS